LEKTVYITLPSKSVEQPLTAGFTLIELSIVLVIIGLIVGGILVGQDLIKAAALRAQISQIEKFNTAANTFREKYQCLPGDCANAANFGFVARGPNGGEGDGNGVIEGYNSVPAGDGYAEGMGETVVFWRDLSTAGLIDGGFATATSSGLPLGGTFSGTSLNLYFPQAKVGGDNYIYVYSGGMSTSGSGGSGAGTNNGLNYFGISAITGITSGYNMVSSPGLNVAQAQNIDNKIDDGLPQSGTVTAAFNFNHRVVWVAGGGGYGASGSPNGAGNPSTAATPGSTTTCYDNSTAAGGSPGVAGATQHYSMEMNSGSNTDCALSFKAQF
jgi:prepilin-type N-terminal cleavage/methylation domain-containing protein